MPLSATAHLSSSVVFIALIVLCLLHSPSFLSPSLRCSTSVCSLLQPWHLVQYITHGRLSTLNLGLPNYLFFRFLCNYFIGMNPPRMGLFCPEDICASNLQAPSMANTQKSSLCSLAVPSNNPLSLPPCRSAPEMKRVLFPLLLFLSGTAINLVHSVSICVSSFPQRC